MTFKQVSKSLKILLILIFFPGYLISQVNIDSGLVAYYPFNGNALDISGNKNHGFVHGAKLTEDRNMKSNSAYYFDGIDDYIHIPFSSDFDFSEEKQISFGCWADTSIIGFGLGGSNFGFFLGNDEENSDNELRAGISASFFWIFVRHKLSPQQKWYQCYVTADDKTIKMYVNGILVKQQSLYNVKWDEISMEGIYVCAENTGNPKILKNFLNGKIDQIRIYNRVLKADEISYLYSNEK